MLFFVLRAIRDKTPTSDQFIGQPRGLISQLVDELFGQTGTKSELATSESFGIFEGTTKGADVVRPSWVNHKLSATPLDRNAVST